MPVAADMSQAYQRYQQGHWILATGKFVDDLASDGRFETARVWADAMRSEGRVVAGAVFHRSHTVLDTPNQ